MALKWRQLASNTSRKSYTCNLKRILHITSLNIRPTHHQVSHSFAQLRLWQPLKSEMSLQLFSSAALQGINPCSGHTLPDFLCCSLRPLPLAVPRVSGTRAPAALWGSCRSLSIAPWLPPPHTELSISPLSHKAPALRPSPSSAPSVLQKAFPQHLELDKACSGKCTLSTILLPRVTFLDLSHLILALLL